MHPGLEDCGRARLRNTSGRTNRCTIRERCRRCHTDRRRLGRTVQPFLGPFANASRNLEEIAEGRLPRGIVFVPCLHAPRIPTLLLSEGESGVLCCLLTIRSRAQLRAMRRQLQVVADG